MSLSHSRTPSTPLSRSASFASKFINKLRTPSGSSPALSTSAQKHPNYSQSSLTSASSSQSSFKMFSGFQNNSKTTLDDGDNDEDEELELEFPTLETSPFKQRADGQPPAMLGSSNPFGRSKSPAPVEDDPTVISRPSTTYDRRSPPPSRAPSRQATTSASGPSHSAQNGSGSSGGISGPSGSADRSRRDGQALSRTGSADKAATGAAGSVGRTWARGRDLISRSPSTENNAAESAGRDVESLSEVLRSTSMADVSRLKTSCAQNLSPAGQ